MRHLAVLMRRFQAVRASRRRRTSARPASHRPPTVETLESRTLLSFAAPVNYGVSAGLQSVAVADINGDGVPDLVTVNSSNQINLLLGNGDGTFQAPVVIDTGITSHSATFVTAAPLTSSGHMDLIVGETGGIPFGGGLAVLLGNGDGTFAPATYYATGFSGSNGPTAVAVADLNGDGIPDLVAAQSGNVGLTSAGFDVLLGNGDGTFQPPKTYQTGTFTGSVAVGDFNGDGKLDVASVTSGYPFQGYQGAVSIYFGNGDGTFAAGPSYTTSAEPVDVVAGDFNGDSVADLVVANKGQSTNSPSVGVLLGNGDGSFQAEQDLSLPQQNPAALVAGDVNGDGHLDVVVGNYQGFTTLLGNGDGTFRIGATYSPSTSNAGTVVLADFNGDGALDVAVANQTSNTVAVRLGNGDGTFATAPAYATGVSPRSVAIGDFNGDGIPDLVTANFGMSPFTNSSVVVLLGNGDGTFQAARTVSTAPEPVAVAVGDFNDDGHLDFVVANYGGSNGGSVTIFLGNGDGTFQTGPTYTVGHDLSDVEVADVTGQGHADLIVVGRNANFTGSEANILLGNGDGTFQAPKTVGIGGQFFRSLAVADLNGDGRADLLVTNGGLTSGSLGVLLGNGDGTFQTGAT